MISPKLDINKVDNLFKNLFEVFLGLIQVRISQLIVDA